MKKPPKVIKKRAASKKVASKSAKPAVRRAAKVTQLPDDPLLRHKKLSADRLVGAADGYLARRRVEALTERARATTGIPTVPPVAGSSNWVQLGPMAIPNGQTYSSARVLVTGRVTAIAIDPLATNHIFIGT